MAEQNNRDRDVHARCAACLVVVVCGGVSWRDQSLVTGGVTKKEIQRSHHRRMYGIEMLTTLLFCGQAMTTVQQSQLWITVDATIYVYTAGQRYFQFVNNKLLAHK